MKPRFEFRQQNAVDLFEGMVTIRVTDGVNDIRMRLPESVLCLPNILSGHGRELMCEFEDRFR